MTSEAAAPRGSEAERLEELERFGAVEVDFDERFDRLLRVATRIFDVPCAMITVVTDQGTHVKAGIGCDMAPVPRGEGICEVVVERGQFVHFRDLREEPELRERVAAKGLPFYAGMPLRSAKGYVLGTLCVRGAEPRDCDLREREILEELADAVVDLLVDHRAGRERDEGFERLKAVSEAPNLMIIEVDDRGIVRHASPSVQPMMGYARSEVEGAHFLDLVDPHRRSGVAAEHSKTIGGIHTEGESKFATKEGVIKTLAWSTCPATGVDGRARMIVALHDVSERIRAQHEIAVAQERYRQVFENSRDAMVFVAADVSGRILEVNAAFGEFLGYSSEELVGMNVEELRATTEPGREEMLKKYDDLVQRGFTDEYEREFRTKQGERVPASVSAWMLRDPSGQPFTILSRLRDIRAQRQRDRDRAVQREELEESVRARTRELEQTLERLRSAERLASVGTLASGVAHQINNPIGAILASAEFALLTEQEEDFKETWRRALMDAVEQSKRCGRIVRSMLQYSRGTRSERWSEDLTLVVPRAIRLAESLTRRETVGLSFECGASHLPVVLNPIEMEQVLVNLIDNAIECSPEGGAVTVSVRREDRTAIVEIVDEGHGIPQADRRRVFDPFYTTRVEQGGTGLGLSVAEGIVRDLGGEIRIEDAPGGGARVVLLLPLDEGAPSGD